MAPLTRPASALLGLLVVVTSCGRAPSSPPPADAGAGDPCTTRITYGSRWIPSPNHPARTDLVPGQVTWDGVCVDEGAGSRASLSNGFIPHFDRPGGCVLALDTQGCPGAPGACETRLTYGPSWVPGPSHPDFADDVVGGVGWDRTCLSDGLGPYAPLSNGWTPHFQPGSQCEVSIRYSQCGGLYQNPVTADGCADPGVLKDGARYVAVCTSGNAAAAFPIRVSTNLVDWTTVGAVFPAGQRPSWATSSFWAPEIHRVGSHYVAYYSARHLDGVLSLGAASGPTATGPFVDLGRPLLHAVSPGAIDVSEFEGADGTPYLVWKEDGNSRGLPTLIWAQPLAPDGLSLVGSKVELLRNDLSWEGAVVEGPFVIRKDGAYFLFYSANNYGNATYAVGVASASAPLGPYTKTGAPLLRSNASWSGPGHCSVVQGPAGEWVMVYHAWLGGHGATDPGPGRLMLVDSIHWGPGPSLPSAPSSSSQPLP